MHAQVVRFPRRAAHRVFTTFPGRLNHKAVSPHGWQSEPTDVVRSGIRGFALPSVGFFNFPSPSPRTHHLKEKQSCQRE
ncbi:hypothetical protein Mal15_47770 [Stieleria maiorica]|uniref:Uncharacterized protein n=1 Tax=Stieleria maiorica TaxID=2795974 RepID=A0A5B9MM47_9BACT|nr:hypothetical protein Mal15_47770 [Stieleria maiorica]